MMPYGWHDGGWGIFWMIASWALIVALGVWLVRSFEHPRTDGEDRPDPERILEERFARGEISEEELADKRRALRHV